MKYNNPIIHGFYPDPSICKFKGKYYLVNSSFEYFPGIPIFESTDLVNWHQIGHVLNRAGQLNLENSGKSKGLFAPTIRSDGKQLYVIVTNETIKKNLYVTTTNPLEGWSDPIFVDDWPGIDPSLFFDNDGQVYIQGNAYKSDEALGIYQAKININTGKLLSNRKLICEGTGGKAPESPHIFKKADFYYLTIAEGGTEYGHMVTIFRSKNINGPFEGYDKNPILSNRSTGNEVQCVGHADFVLDYNNNWWLVALGIRTLGHHAYYHFIGRESFLSPVVWNEEGWPIVNNDGHMYLSMNGPLINKQLPRKNDLYINFETETKIPERLVFLRNPIKSNYQIVDNLGLKLTGIRNSISTTADVTFLGLRQSEHNVEYEAVYDTQNDYPIKYGVTVFMSRDFHYDLYLDTSDSTINLSVTLESINQVIKSVPVEVDDQIEFKIDSDSKYYKFKVETNKQIIDFGFLDTNLLSSEISATFSGVMLGAFVESISKNNGSIMLKKLRYKELINVK